MIFDGFDAEHCGTFETFLVMFRGYVSHRMVRMDEAGCEIRCESAGSAASLGRNVRKMMEYQGVPARISRTMSTIVVEGFQVRG